MLWVDTIVVVAELKFSKWIAKETRSQAAIGKKLEICNLQDIAMCLLHFQNLMISVECSASTKTLQQK